MGSFPQTAQRDQPYIVPTRSTGPAQAVMVWLEDGQSAASLSGSPVGAVNVASVVLVPKVAGSYRLYARVFDGLGCERDRTASARWVTVN